MPALANSDDPLLIIALRPGSPDGVIASVGAPFVNNTYSEIFNHAPRFTACRVVIASILRIQKRYAGSG